MLMVVDKFTKNVTKFDPRTIASRLRMLNDLIPHQEWISEDVIKRIILSIEEIDESTIDETTIEDIVADCLMRSGCYHGAILYIKFNTREECEEKIKNLDDGKPKTEIVNENKHKFRLFKK